MSSDFHTKTCNECAHNCELFNLNTGDSIDVCSALWVNLINESIFIFPYLTVDF